MREVLKKFGRYFLLDQLAQGGMAEIYRARLASIDGAGRLMVIKRIQAGHGANSEFVQMFRSETKVMMGFNHPNIVQLYDFGEEQGQPYISMEWVDGMNLKQFLNRFNELKQSFPIELATHILEQAACGLHYAHSFKDKITGAPLGVVHRDISPQNILIAYEGGVKVIDFGIAKAATNSEETRAGIIKGKPSYLSPEQISGEPLDGRCDIFALGTVMWELLTGKKLFAGESDLAVLKMIESCSSHVRPPSTVNSNVPKELDYIILKCLAKQRDKRYQTAEELQRALHRFLYVYSPDFDPSDLGRRAKDLFKDEIVEDRKRIQRLNDKVEQLLSSEHIHEGKTSYGIAPLNIPSAESEEGTRAFRPVERVIPNVGESPSLQVEPTATRLRRDSSKTMGGLRPPEQRLRREGGWGWIFGGLAAAGVAAYFVVPRYWSQDPASHTQRSTAAVAPEEAPPPAPPPTETVPEVTLQATPQATQGAAPGSKTVLLKVKLNILDPATKIFLNGQALDPRAPQAIVPLDKHLELAVENPSYQKFHSDFTLSPDQIGDQKEWTKDVVLEPKHFGYLNLNSTPSSDVTIMIDGVPWKRHTPIENERLPAGDYSVSMKNEIIGSEKTLMISVHDGEVVNIDTRLEIKN